MVPAAAPVRSSGTRRVAHSTPSPLAHGRQRSAAGAAEGAATRTRPAARIAAATRRPGNLTGDAGIAAEPTRSAQVTARLTRQMSYRRAVERPASPQYADQLVENSPTMDRGMAPEPGAPAREW